MVLFALAQLAFLDHNRVILEDLEHSNDEKRYYLSWQCGWWYYDCKIYLPKK